MELPHLGQHCSKSGCHKLDFLPIKCDTCNDIFCDQHFQYVNHECKDSYKKNNQVPVCPLCNVPVPVQKGMQPDAVVGYHIDNDCKSDSEKKRIFKNKCSMKKCKISEIIPIVCTECSHNYCLKHRHPADHSCQGPAARRRNISQTKSASTIQANLSEDEALARALHLSMQENNPRSTKKTQEELDHALARQLQYSEAGRNTGTNPSSSRCNVS